MERYTGQRRAGGGRRPTFPAGPVAPPEPERGVGGVPPVPVSPGPHPGDRRPVSPPPPPENDTTLDHGPDFTSRLRNRIEAANRDAAAGHAVPEPAAPAAERPRQNRRVSRKFVAIAGISALALCAVAVPSAFQDNPSGHRPGQQVGTSGPNRLPANPITGEPMGTAEQRKDHVQRAVNSGEYGKTVHTLPGVLTYRGDSGRNVTVRNPIIVSEGLPGGNATTFDPKKDIFGGRIFGLTPGSYDPTQGVGQSYGVVPVEPGSVIKWDGPVTPKAIVDVELGWRKSDAGEGLHPGKNEPYMQNSQGNVLPPGTPDTATTNPYVVGHMS